MVRFHTTARCIEASDNLGVLIFTFDVGLQDPKAVVLNGKPLSEGFELVEVNKSNQSRVEALLQEVVSFLESRDYTVSRR